MNLDLKGLSQCLKANKLPLIVMKIELSVFYPGPEKTDHSLKFKLDRKRLRQTEELEYLGVLLGNHLIWLKQKKTMLQVNQTKSLVFLVNLQAKYPLRF